MGGQGGETSDAWRQNHFLQGLPPGFLDALAPMIDMRVHPDGEAILREGEESDRICLLAAGRVAVKKGAHGARLGSVEAGGYFGEMGVLSGAPRSTSVVADGTAEVWSISRDALRRFEDATGLDLLGHSLKSHANVLGERLAHTNSVAAESMRARLEEYRIRVSFGTLFTNVILMVFVYTSALSVLRQLSATGGSSTITTSALLVLMALGSAWIMRASGFPAATFGFSLARWRWVVLDALAWSAVFCAAITAIKWALITFSAGHGHLQLFKPWTSPDGPGATLFAYSLYVVLSPVQEFVARGMMQGSLQKMLTGRHVALRSIVVANAIFSISHQHLGLGYALAVFLPGMFWGWMYYRHGSLLGVSLSHVLIGMWSTGLLDLASVVPK